MTALSSLKRWLPLIALAGAMVLARVFGLHEYLSFKTIGLNYQDMKAFIVKRLGSLGVAKSKVLFSENKDGF